jgi:UDP-2,3-diacylglucosamine pyrophosphatase LpxH
MDLDKMTTAEVEALLRLLADMEREELELVMLGRRMAEWEGRYRARISDCSESIA